MYRWHYRFEPAFYPSTALFSLYPDLYPISPPCPTRLHSPPPPPISPTHTLLALRPKLPSRKEKRVPLRIAPHAPRVIFPRVELLPHARGEDVLVPLVPPAVDDFRHVRIVVAAFEAGVERGGRARGGFSGGPGERVGGGRVDGGGGAGGGGGFGGGQGAVVEEGERGGREGLVDDEVVEVVVLRSISFASIPLPRFTTRGGGEGCAEGAE